MSSLSLPPIHPRFPSLPVLNAICAIGSFYTLAVTLPPLPDFNQVSPGGKTVNSRLICGLFTVSEEIFLDRIQEGRRIDSFAEQQAKIARESAERFNSLGKDLFRVFQCIGLLNYFTCLLIVLVANVILTGR
jgi:hypothetical protein